MPERPYVFLNMAMTADGKIDTVARQGARISGAADSARVDGLRADADAIMVGGHTLVEEDPRLTVRDEGLIAGRIAQGRPGQPTKVGVASRLARSGAGSLPAAGGFLGDGDGQVIVFTSARTEADAIAALQTAGAEVCVAGTERVDLPQALATLSARGIERLMVEGGGTLVAALLDSGLVDELQLALAPLIFGGETAPTPVAGAGRSRAEALDLELAGVTTSPDGDVILRYLVGAAR